MTSDADHTPGWVLWFLQVVTLGSFYLVTITCASEVSMEREGERISMEHYLGVLRLSLEVVYHPSSWLEPSPRVLVGLWERIGVRR